MHFGGVVWRGEGIRWLSWKQMCIPKNLGGMGFRSLHEFNLVLLAKQGWKLLRDDMPLVRRVFNVRYYP